PPRPPGLRCRNKASWLRENVRHSLFAVLINGAGGIKSRRGTPGVDQPGAFAYQGRSLLKRSEAQLAARLGELDLRPGTQANPISHPLGENHAPRRVNLNRQDRKSVV